MINNDISPAENAEAYKAITDSTSTPICAGENHYLAHGFRRLMEINAVDFAWADLAANPAQADGRTADFQNTLTHELGHVIGLAHNCYATSDGPAPLADNTGNPEVLCGGADTPASVYDATMYPVVGLSDVARRTLSSDDAQAACDVYPSSQSLCGVSSSGCSMLAGSAPIRPSRRWGVVLGGLLALSFATLALRRPRRRP